MSRPARAPGLLAALEAALPARIVKRVKDQPGLAEAWMWAASCVTIDDVVVSFGADPATLESLTCTCLMAPKCVHVLAVATALPESAAPVPAPVVARPAPEAPGGAGLPAAEAALADLLRLGAHSADALVRADLTWGAYEARALGLHRLGRALTRVVVSLRLYASGHPTFAIAAFMADTEEALLVARQLTRSADPRWIGSARRRYAPVGNLRLWGLCAEVIVNGGGASGVVSWLADARGRLWTVPDLRPRALGQAVGVYDVAPPLTMLSHRKLCREGLFIQGATAADDGRLGAGEGVSAVRSEGVGWSEAPLSALWGAEGAPLRFVSGHLRGTWRDALVVAAPDGDVYVLPGSEHTSLPWRENLRLLARLPDRGVQLVGREVAGRRRAVIGLALASPGLSLPETWRGRVNLGLDRLTTSHLLDAASAAVSLTGEAADRADVLAPVRRRLTRALLGGAETLPADVWSEVEREARRLREAVAPGAADLLVHLATSAKTEAFSTAWLAMARYLTHVDHRRAREAWTGAADPQAARQPEP